MVYNSKYQMLANGSTHLLSYMNENPYNIYCYLKNILNFQGAQLEMNSF